MPKSNDKKRGIRNRFDHASRTLFALRKTKCWSIRFPQVISPDNYLDLVPLYERCAALDAAEKVAKCQRNGAFIVTERYDMVRRPWKPILWVLKNPWQMKQGPEIS